MASLVVLLVILSAFATDAQLPIPTYAVSGFVQSEGGTPVPGLMVYLEGSVSSYTATDSRGAFQFTRLLPGQYTIRVGTVSGLEIKGSPQNVTVVHSNLSLNFTARASKLLRVEWEKLAELVDTASEARSIRRRQSVVGAIRAPSGLVSAWLAITLNEPSLALPPGIEVTYHCSSSMGMALFVGKKNVFGDSSIKYEHTAAGGGCSL